MLMRELSLFSLIIFPFLAKAEEIPAIVNLGVEVTDFRLCGKTLVFDRWEEWGDYVDGEWVELPVDITGDGDTEDCVSFVQDVESGEMLERVECGSVSCQDPDVGLGRYRGDIYDNVLHVADIKTGEVTNLGFAVQNEDGGGCGEPPPPWLLSGEWLVFQVDESRQGGDFNEDGDEEDFVLHAYNLRESAAKNLGLVGSILRISGNWLALSLWEEDAGGEDFNEDGDSSDRVLHVLNIETGEMQNVGVETYEETEAVRLSEKRLVFIQDTVHVYDFETRETADLRFSAAGMQEGLCFGAASWMLELSEDWLVFVTRGSQESDLNPENPGTPDTGILHLYDFTTRRTTNLALAVEAVTHSWLAKTPWVSVSENRAAFLVRESAQGRDLNGDTDRADDILHVADLEKIRDLPRFRRGDCNDDGEVDISDAVCILGWLFLGEEEPGCVAVTNTNGDVGADLSDAVYLLGHLFLGGPPPVAPFPECGPVPDDEDLACEIPPTSCR